MAEIKKIGYQYLGFQPYYESINIQNQLQYLLILEKTDYEGFLLFLYHEPIITLGKYSDYSNLLVDRQELDRHGVEFYHSDRGGDITCHEPGQIVVYPIINLKRFNLKLKDYVFLLERVVMDLLNHFKIQSERIKGKPGVWIGNRKIASLGISVKRHCTKHGIALNVNNSLNSFGFINPCGYREAGITSLKKQLNMEVDLKECTDKILAFFASILGTSTEEIDINNFILTEHNQIIPSE